MGPFKDIGVDLADGVVTIEIPGRRTTSSTSS